MGGIKKVANGIVGLAVLILALASVMIAVALIGWTVGFIIELALGSVPANIINDITGSSFVKGDIAKMSALVSLSTTWLIILALLFKIPLGTSVVVQTEKVSEGVD